MKIYISLPITGFDIEQVDARCTFATGVLKTKGHEAVNPLDVCGACGDELDYIGCMANDINALLRCDAVVMLDGWENSKGCQLERSAAQIYGLQVFDSLDKVPESNALWHVLGKEVGDETKNRTNPIAF